MKTFKKLFAYSAIFALLATMMPTYANAASYDAELTEAYAYAKNKWITTMTSIDNADMYGNLTRVAMAKMVANYVLDLGLQELDTDKECNFPDVSASLDEAYDNGVTKACQLGLMGVGIEKFNPNGIVTRAEFGTVLSRALWGEENNGGNPYYAKHLQALKDEGIMNKIDNPNMKEVRGYVMLMMMRADDAYTPTTGCSAEELLACILAEDYQACIATCSEDAEEEVVLPGYVTVSTKADSSQTVAKNAVDKKVGTVTLRAGENDSTVTVLEITRSGLGLSSDIKTISLVDKNGNYVTNAATMTNNVSKLRFRPNLVIKANGSETFDVVVSTKAEGGAGIHNFAVTSVTVSNGKFGGTPANLGSLTVANYSVEELAVTMTNKSADAGDKDVELASIKLQPKADAKVNSLTLISENDLSLNNIISNVKAYIDDKEVGTVVVNDESIVINGLNQSIKKNKSVDLILKWDIVFVWDNGKVFKFTIEDNRVVATEDNTGERMFVVTKNSTLTITNWVGLTMTNNVKKTQKVVVDSEDVVLMDVNVKATANVEVLSYTLKIDNYSTLADLEDLRISVDWDEYELSSLTVTEDGNSQIKNLADKYLNAFTIDAWKSVNVKVLATAKENTATWKDYKVTLYVHKLKNLDTNKLVWADFNDITTNLDKKEGHATQVVNGSLNITKKSTDGTTIKVGENKTILSFSLKSKAEDATLKTLTVSSTESATLADIQKLKNDIIDTLTLVQGSSKKEIESDDLVLMVSYKDVLDNNAQKTATYLVNEDYTDSAKYDAVKYFLNGEFKSLSYSIKEANATSFEVQAKVSSDLDVTDLSKTLVLNVRAGGIVAKGNISDNNITNTSAIEGKSYQIVTTKPSIEIEKDGKYILVTVNNESDYNIQLNGLGLEVLSAKDKDNNQLLASNTPWILKKDSTDGLAYSTGTEVDLIGKIPGTPSWTFQVGKQPVIAEWESMTFVIELQPEVGVASTDYTAVKKSMNFNYLQDDWVTLVNPAIKDTY